MTYRKPGLTANRGLIIHRASRADEWTGRYEFFATEFAPLALPSRFSYLPPAVAKGTIYDCLHHPELPVTNPLIIQSQTKVFDDVSDIIPH